MKENVDAIGRSTKFKRILLNDPEPEHTRRGKRGEGGGSNEGIKEKKSIEQPYV